MAVEKQAWLPLIIEGLFADNTFMAKSVNLDAFVSNDRVHIPNAGAPSNVEKNRTRIPATAKTRTDVDIDFKMDSYTTDPVLIPFIEEVQTSYNKRQSVLSQDKAALHEKVAEGFIENWCKDIPATHLIETTGKKVLADLPDATGNRKAFVKADVKNAMRAFNKDDVPQEGRYMLISADMHAQLLEDLTESEANAFLACADASKGIVGKLFSFNFMLRSQVGRVDGTSKTFKSWEKSGAATDLDMAMAWHEKCVGRAKGEPKMFACEGDPKSYGDLFSFLVLAGGRRMRSDNKGVYGIVQGSAD